MLAGTHRNSPELAGIRKRPIADVGETVHGCCYETPSRPACWGAGHLWGGLGVSNRGRRAMGSYGHGV
eukprot:9970366-Alexandrium_andersonii.AAC.1